VRPGTLAALPLLLALAAALGLAADSHARLEPGSGATGATLITRAPGRLIVQTPGYQVALSKENGQLLYVISRATGTRVVSGQNGCGWGATSTPEQGGIGGCAFAPAGDDRFSYRWSASADTLTMTYTGDSSQARYTNAVVTLTAHETYFDLQLSLENHRGATLAIVSFPADLLVSSSTVVSGYAPNYLPGMRFEHAFFSRVGNDVNRYPSRWAFADYLALDVGSSSVALYSVNPAPSPIAPVDLGFDRNGPGAACSGSVFCVVHAFQTWVRDGETWTSPPVRIRVGDPVRDTVLDYRDDNGIDAYPSLEQKVGPLLPSLARAPLIKADLWRGLPAFRDWGNELGELPSPALVHPVAFQPGGHDESYPDFLPPDPRWGTTSELRAAVEQAHARGQLVMPYLNVSWWNPNSPTLQNLPPPSTLSDVAMLDASHRPVEEDFPPHEGFIVSPYSQIVRSRVAQELDEWRTEVPADCLFFDQIGARPWRRDFNPAEPTPLAYEDGWLALMAPYASRCLMAEDGWDRLAQSFSGFLGGALLMQREFDDEDRSWGAGNWAPYPLALWMLHDKVLFYQHDLYPGTMTTDPEVLTWNLAFGFMLSYDWRDDDHTLDSPWLGLVARVQQTLGPHYAGKPLTGFRYLAPDVTETDFGDYSVIANWSRTTPFDYAGQAIAPLGFVAQTSDGVLAATYGDTWSGVTFGSRAR
jgi:hypothetical protein